jgi:hypothetical protein
MHTGILGQEGMYAYCGTLGQERGGVGLVGDMQCAYWGTEVCSCIYCGFWGSLHFEVKVKKNYIYLSDKNNILRIHTSIL